MLSLTLYSRPDCSLCDEMKAVLLEVRRDIPFRIEEIDISISSALQNQFSLEIPVLYINGQPAFMYEISAHELRQRLVQESKGT